MKFKNTYFKTIRSLILITSSALLISCATNYGKIGIGHPIVLTPEQSKKSLECEYKKFMDKANNIDPLVLNQSLVISENLFNTLLLKTTSDKTNRVGESAAPTNSSSNTKPEFAALGKDNASLSPNGLLMDQFSTIEAYSTHLQRKHDTKESLLNLKDNERLYKINFTLNVEPMRQDYWTYLWRWARFDDGFFRNYTKDYHLDITLKPKALSSKNSCTTSVVMVQPANEGSISDDGAVLSKSSKLGASASWQTVSALLDLEENQRQQFVEQRKYPILRSYIESDGATEFDTTNVSKPASFHYIISPRQHVEQRSLRVPFLMSRYSLKRRLESVPYNVSAFIMLSCNKKDNSISLPIEISACYKQYGNPERQCEDNVIPFDNKINVTLPDPEKEHSPKQDNCGS